MRKDGGDMEIALDVPQPRLHAVPSEPVPPDDSATDAELLARVGERDREAFELLYGRYVRSVFGLALRRLGDRGHAEDAVQEAFAAIWRSASTYRPERGAAGGWLYTVARNAIVDRLRRSGPAADAELPELASPDPGPAQQAEDVRRRLARAPRPRGAPASGARGDRARLLERHVAERGGRVSPPAARNGEDPDAKRPRAARIGAGRRVAVNREPTLDELIGADTTGAERQRLQHVHELLRRGRPAAGADPGARGGAEPQDDHREAPAGREAAGDAPARRRACALAHLPRRLRRREPAGKQQVAGDGCQPQAHGHVRRPCPARRRVSRSGTAVPATGR